MNPLLLILIEAGFNIGAAHAGSKGGTVIKTGGFLLDAARAIDSLYQEEHGVPLDWSRIREHEHLPEPGPNVDPPDPSQPPDPAISDGPQPVESDDPETGGEEPPPSD